MMKRFVLIVMLVSTVVAFLFVSGCATTRGLGQDIKSVGQSIEGAAQ
ncbi:MAG: entericidin A/B family lipoprotein [bacterium]